MYESILFPTDGSETSRAALDHVRNQAEKHDATVHVLYVIDIKHAGVPTSSGPGFGGSSEDINIDEVKSEASEIVDREAEHLGDIEIQTTVQTGKPYETILEYVDEAGIDMVVMSTHGRSGIDRYVMGSVTEKVTRHAPVPVLSVRADDS